MANTATNIIKGTKGDDVLIGTAGSDEITGLAGNDQIDGAAGDDVLSGGDGDDAVVGGDGNDMLDGGTGADRMEGGAGADIYYVDDENDVVVESQGADKPTAVKAGSAFEVATTADTVIARISFGLPADVENLQLAGDAGDINGYGNELANKLLGNTGNNLFRGLGADDFIDGNAGRDTVTYSAPFAHYEVTKAANGFTVFSDTGVEGFDTLVNIERVAFTDQGLALDVAASEAGGQCALLVGAVLGKAALAAKKPLVGAVIDLLDQGFTLNDLSGAVMRLPIWGLLANNGGESATNAQIALYLLTTVNQVVPDAATLNAAASALNAETGETQGAFLAELAQSTANQLQVGLLGLAATGLEYGP